VSGALLIRDAEPLDVPAVAEIFAHYAVQTVTTFETSPLPASYWLDKLTDAGRSGHPFLVGVLDTTVVGYAYAVAWRTKPGYAHTVEDSIYLRADLTGRGFGGALLAELVSRCATSGFRQMIAVIADSGDPASLALHRRAGFTEAGRLRAVGCKHQRWLDTVLMQRQL